MAHVDAELVRYQQSGWEVFQDSQFLSMAPDVGKIGGTGMLISPIVKNGIGEAMWDPPVVIV